VAPSYSGGVDADRPSPQPAEALPPSPPPSPPPSQGLSERDRAVLEFERRWWKHQGVKEQAVREAFDLSATRYYQVLNALLEDPAAMAADPLLVQRLRRLRDQRRAGSSISAPERV